MKPIYPSKIDPEYWVLLAPGLVGGTVLGMILAECCPPPSAPQDLWLLALLVVAATLLSRSLVFEAVAAFNAIKEPEGALVKLALVQVPMLISGLLLAFSLGLFVSELSSDGQLTLIAVVTSQSLLTNAVSFGGGSARVALLAVALGFFSVCQLAALLDKLGYLQAFIDSL